MTSTPMLIGVDWGGTKIEVVAMTADGTELLRIRATFPHGGYPLRIEPATFNLGDYRRFLAEEADSIAAFKARQQAAFEAERERWVASGQADHASDADVAAAAPDSELDLPPGGRAVATSVPGNVWQVPVKEGQQVQAGG